MSGVNTFGAGAEPDFATIEREFDRAWHTPRWLGRLSAANHVILGRRYVFTAFVFLLVGGIEAMFMRTQLIFPDNHVLTAYQYYQLMTMHGTTMLFLFGTPVMEGVALFLLPAMIGARDIAFPRLTAFGYWLYLSGGILLYCSFLVEGAPYVGWWSYQPLTSITYQPGLNQDFWYFGVAMIESASTVTAIELIVTILKSRAPGFSLNRMSTYAWYILGTSIMIVFAFPIVAVICMMAEAERRLGMPFFTAEGNGRPVLWQHLFWIFCHPEVYVLFLPGSGLVSAMLPTLTRERMSAYAWLVLAVVATVFFSFGLWVHHMYTTGIPRTATSFFSGASLAVAVPSGIQIFAYLATIWNGRPVINTPFLFILGFIFIFVVGGLSGVTVAIVPFDWQVNDTYYVIAHFHYVIIGANIFPLLAAMHFYMPMVSGRMMSERLGKWSFALVFAGFNVGFFPMHLSGLWGMPRRVYTYPASSGWGATNLTSSIGAYVMALGILVFIANIVLHCWRGERAGINPWKSGSLEWAVPLPIKEWKFRSIPEVRSEEPLWDDPDLPTHILEGEGLLARVHHDAKETLTTSMVSAEPEDVKWLPKPSFMPMLAALAVTLLAAALLARLPWLAVGATGAGALFAAIWMWDRRPLIPDMDVGHGLTLPVNVGESDSTERFGMLVFLMADFAAWGCLVYSYFFLWATSAPWPPAGYEIGHFGLAWIATGLLAAGLIVAALARRAGRAARMLLMVPLMLLNAIMFVAACWCVWQVFSDLPFEFTSDAYAALVVTLVGFGVVHLAIAVLLMLFCIARGLTGHIRPRRHLTSYNTGLFSMYSAVQMLVMLGIVYL